jgi:hypothetical protein
MSLSEQARTRAALVGTALVVPLLFFHRAAFSEEIFISRDILRVYYPLRKYWVERVSQLQFPDWYPYDGLGQPYAGMPISGTFHPANLLYLLLPLGTALKAVTLLSYVAALGGTYLFARSWNLGRGPALLSGLSYALCGYMVGISNNLLYLMAAATFPWALWGAERFLRQPSPGRAAAAALPLCLVLLGGDPQSFAVCNGLLLVLALLRPGQGRGARALPWAALLIVLGALLSAVQIVPTLHVLGQAHPSAATLDVATRFSFHPLRLGELVLGPLFVDPEVGAVSSPGLADQVLDSGMGTLWVDSVHLGATACLLLLGALWAHRRQPRVWWVAGLALFFLLLSMGRALPLYGWLYRWLPLWGSFRYPEKLLPYFLFPCALGAGAGLEALEREPSLRRRLGLAGLGLAALCGGLALAEGWGGLFSRGVVGSRWATPDPAVLELIHGNVVRMSLLTAGTFLLSSLVLLGVERSGPRVGLLAAMQLGVLYLSNQATYHVTYPDVLEQTPGLVEQLHQHAPDTGAGRARTVNGVRHISPPEIPGLGPMDVASLYLSAALEPDIPALWNLESATPYLPAASQRYADLYTSLPFDTWWNHFAGLFDVRYLTVDGRTFQQMGAPREQVVSVDRSMGLVLLQHPKALPRAYLAPLVCVPDARSARAHLLSASFQPGREAVIECAGLEDPPLPASGEPGQVTFLRYEPEHVELDVKAPGPEVLVLNDAWYSGWSATLDGEPVPVLPANVAVRGVRVPAGAHRVVFSYRTPGRFAGVAVSLGTLVLLVLATLGLRRTTP